MSLRTLPRAARLAPALALLLAVLASGCGDAGVGKTYPVSGKVTIGGEALVARSAVVMFVPDTAKGNTSPYEPAASVDANGDYTLSTKAQRGAPPGWYKVVVTATAADTPPPPKRSLKERPLPKSLVPAEYGQAKTTPLSIEVVATPAAGAYDLKLKK